MPGNSELTGPALCVKWFLPSQARRQEQANPGVLARIFQPGQIATDQHGADLAEMFMTCLHLCQTVVA